MPVALYPADCLVIGQEDGTISIDSEMITVAKYPANMMISYDILVSGVIDRYSCHYSSQYLVSVFDSLKINLFEHHSTRQTMMSSLLQSKLQLQLSDFILIKTTGCQEANCLSPFTAALHNNGNRIYWKDKIHITTVTTVTTPAHGDN